LAPSQARAQSADVASVDTISITTHEGTTLAFDLSRDGRTLVFDLLGQLWVLGASGGEARPITDAARDTAEDLDPSLSPDGTLVLFEGERGGRRGLWLVERSGHAPPRQLTHASDPDAIEGRGAWSPDGRTIAFVHETVGVSEGEVVWKSTIELLDLASGTTRSLLIEGPTTPKDPAWGPLGDRIAFVAPGPGEGEGDRIWRVPIAGGSATPLTNEIEASAPAFSPDGGHIAFLARDSAGRPQVWVQEIPADAAAPGADAAAAPLRLTNHRDVALTRVRWTPEGQVLYSADGRLWRVPASGGPPSEIPFTANLTFTRPRSRLLPVTFPTPGKSREARGHMGLALSPDARRIGVIALGKLWVAPVGGEPRAVADVPSTAQSLAWSPDGSEIAWAAGAREREDIFATELASGRTRRVTELPGSELVPLWSPDGERLAFEHAAPDSGFRLRVVEARAETARDPEDTRDLGEVPGSWVGETATAPAWSPDSRSLLVRHDPDRHLGTAAEIVSLDGERRELERFADGPIFLQWASPDSIVFVRHDRLWTAAFDTTRGVLGEPMALSDAPALYASAARDGTILYLSKDGWRLRSPSGSERELGWLLRYTTPVPEPLLIRNLRVIDGTGAPALPPSDVLIEKGKIVRISTDEGLRPEPGTRVLDAEGRFAIPGLMELHMHSYAPAELPGLLYYGVTAFRDQGSRINTLVATAEAIAAGVMPGPRASFGGFQFYSDWSFDSEEWRGIEPEADPAHVERAVSLAEALGAHHIKTRTFRRWDINARMIEAAHRRGIRVTGHCAHPLPLVAAGIEAQEHLASCTLRGDPFLYDDILQLYRAAGVSVVPTITYWGLAARVIRDRGVVPDADLDTWEPIRGDDWMLAIPPERLQYVEAGVAQQREMVAGLHQAGVRLGVGTDQWQVPWAVHLELEELVRSGLTPLEAIHAATGASAKILGAEGELGTIAVGKWADLVILDADPLADIRNTRRIHTIVKGGEIVDRAAIREQARQW
jgi:Tol biopolymer transport system component